MVTSMLLKRVFLLSWDMGKGRGKISRPCSIDSKSFEVSLEGKRRRLKGSITKGSRGLVSRACFGRGRSEECGKGVRDLL